MQVVVHARSQVVVGLAASSQAACGNDTAAVANYQ
jgi:hypothetical protein